MRATTQILFSLGLIGALGAGCSMNDQSLLTPMEYVRSDWNDNLEAPEGAQQSMYSSNQNWLASDIRFHDYVQRDMGLNPGGVWYPTYAMADGEVPLPGDEKMDMAMPEPEHAGTSSEYRASDFDHAKLKRMSERAASAQ